MALTSTQKFQAARIPIVDASLDSDDAYALAGIVFPLTSAPSLSSDIKKQFAGIPIVDASLDEKDAFAFARAPQSGGGGNTTDVFSLTWTVDPTYSFTVSDPDAGTLSVNIRGFGVGISGFSEPPAAPNVTYGTGRGKKKGKGVRLSVNINGENVPVSSVDEAQALLKAQAHPKERIKRRNKPRARIIESLRPDIPVSEQVEALGQNIGEIADAAVRNTEVVELFNRAVADQSIAALGALRLAIENAQEAPEPAFTPPEVQITPEEQELANGLMAQVGVFDEALGLFLKGISEMEREAYREMDAIMQRQQPKYDALSKDRFNEAMRLWGEEVNKRNADKYNERVKNKRKRFDAFKKVFK